MTQIEAIRTHLLRGKPITPLQALDKYGCFRLAAVVFNLKQEGLRIHTDIECRNGKRWAVYTFQGYA